MHRASTSRNTAYRSVLGAERGDSLVCRGGDRRWNERHVEAGFKRAARREARDFGGSAIGAQPMLAQTIAPYLAARATRAPGRRPSGRSDTHLLDTRDRRIACEPDGLRTFFAPSMTRTSPSLPNAIASVPKYVETPRAGFGNGNGNGARREVCARHHHLVLRPNTETATRSSFPSSATTCYDAVGERACGESPRRPHVVHG